MLEKVTGNFNFFNQNFENGLRCDQCDMTQTHCVSCPGREEDRRGLNMSNLDDLVQYFTHILDNRRR